MNELATDTNLVWVCLIAFAGVIGLLSLLAGLIYLIENLFPARKDGDALIVQAIQKAVDSAFPGAKVVKIDEIKR